jgi:anaphase-promoting complex subunit 8
VATCYYNTQEYDHSLEAFEKLIDLDPYRFENMDTYSNILYIKES